MKYVGVTGGQGFIGGHVCDELLRRGYRPVIFDRRMLPTPKGCDGFLGDVTDSTAVHELAAHVDGIIHLAAILGTQETVKTPGPAVATNITGALNVIDAASSNGVPVVNIAVGNWWMRNSYSTTKHCAERLFEQFRNEAGLAVNQVRVVNAYGPRQVAAKPYGPSKVRKIVTSFTCRALAGDPIEVYGDGLQVSDCVYVGDVASALVSALEHAADGDVFDRVVEVGPAEHHTVLDIARMVKAAAGSDSEIVHLPMRPGEEPGARVVADVSTLPLVGMSADGLVPLTEGLARTVEWFRAHEGVTWRRS